LNYRQLTHRLKKLGCFLDRYARGDHEIWMNSTTKARTTIPNWGSKDLKAGTISRILKDLGIGKSDFEQK
jgi:mRNA interferase HicA